MCYESFFDEFFQKRSEHYIMYSGPLWTKFKKSSIQMLQIAYNDGLHILLKKPRWSSASELFCRVGVNTFHALLRNLMHSFIFRLNGSCNLIIRLLSNPGISTVSIPVNHVDTLLSLPFLIVLLFVYVLLFVLVCVCIGP